MKQVELAQQLGVSKAYISMIMSGKKKPSKRITTRLNGVGVNLEMVNFEARNPILSHARLPIPTLPRKVRLATDIISEKVNQVNHRYTFNSNTGQYALGCQVFQALWEK